MMRRSRVALFSFYAVVAILAITIGIAFTMDFGRFKGNAESLLSDLLDRELAIDGPLHLRIGRTIDLSAESIRLASTDWSADPQLASIRRLEASINTWSLINRPIMIESLSIEGVRINLEHNADRENNWTLFKQSEESADEALSDGLEHLPVMLDDTRIGDTVVNYTNSDRPRPIRFSVNELVQGIDDSGHVRVRLEGDINETPLDLEVSAGLVENIINFADVEFGLSGNLGEITLDGNVFLADLLHPSRPTAQLNLNGPNVEYLTDILTIERITSGPLNVSLSISPIGETMQLSLSGDVGEFALLANGQFVDLQQLENIDLQVSASGPSASTVAELLGRQNVPDDPFNIIGNFQRAGTNISVEAIKITVGDTQFDISGQFEDFPDPSSASGTVRISGPDFGRFNKLLGLPGKLDGPFELDADITPLEAGGAKVDLTAYAQDITLSVNGTVTDQPKLLGSRVRVETRGQSLGAITDAVGIDGIPNIPFDIAATVERVAAGFAIDDGSVRVGGDSATISGLVGEEPLSRDTDIQFEVTLPELTNTLAGFRVEVEHLPSGSLRAAGAVRGQGDYLALQGITVSYAGAETHLSGRLGDLPTLEGTNLELSMSGDEFSRLLPPGDAFKALGKPYSVTSDVSLVDSTLELSSVEFQIDRFRLTADVEFALDPVLNHGRFSLEATSPDLFVLLPQFAEIAVLSEMPLELRASGDWADNLWSLDEFDMKLAEGTLRTSGTIDGPPNFDRTDLTFDWTISSINNYSILAGRELPDEPGHLKFHLIGTREVISIDEFNGVLGDSDLSGTFSMRDGDVPTIAISLTSNRLNLTPYLPQEPEVPTEQHTQPTQEEDRVIPDNAVRIDVLEKFLASLDIRINEVNLRERTLHDVALSGSVVDGALTINEFNIESVQGDELSGQMSLRPADAGAELTMRVAGSNISIGLPAYSAEELEALPRFELGMALMTTGNTLREMAGNMNGYLRLSGGEGQVRLGAMRMFGQDFLFELLNTLNPFSATDPYTNLECMVILAAVEDGQLAGDPVLIVQSDKMKIVADAIVDLKTERLDADFNTVPQQGLGISLSNLINPYVKVSGTLANPALGFDPETALVEGSLAVATVGLSVLARNLTDRFLSAKDPCGKAISDADETFRALEQKYGRSGAAALR